MIRYILFLAFLLFAGGSLSADALSTRLRLLLPGEEPARVNERQFLYQRISQLMLTLEKDDRVQRGSTKKRISKIQSRLRRDHLLQYQASATLTDAFRKGSYSDATAVVLTALLFEKYEVAYDGYVDYWEAYLIADPDERKVEIRHPQSQKWKEVKEENFRQDYISLVRATVAEEAPVLSAEEAKIFFYRYHYTPSKKLSFGQLSAYLQYRRAQAAYAEEKYQQTIDLLEAALRREERPAFLVLRRAAELQLAALNRPEVAGDIAEFFQQWEEAPDNRYLPAAILQHFDEQQRLLLAQKRPDLAQKLLENYQNRAPVGHEKWQAELAHLHHLRLLNHYFSNGRLDLAKGIAEDLYAENADNEAIRYILGEIVIDNLRRGKSSGTEFSSRVEAAANKYPFIRQQDRFADLLLREQAWKVRDLYAEDRPDLAGPALDQFRQFLVDIPIGRERNLWTLTAFISASNYHFRMEDYHGARHFLEEALRYAPDDPYLTHRRTVLAKY